jgi:hypothetical protein
MIVLYTMHFKTWMKNYINYIQIIMYNLKKIKKNERGIRTKINRIN